MKRVGPRFVLIKIKDFLSIFNDKLRNCSQNRSTANCSLVSSGNQIRDVSEQKAVSHLCNLQTLNILI